MMIRCAFAFALLLAATALDAQGQTIYRCGPDGKVYSQVPCAEGTVMDASDPRTAAQRAEARRVAAQERQAATDLERERVARERAPGPKAASLSGPAALAAAAASKPSSGSTTSKKPKAGAGPKKDFVVVAPKPVKSAPTK
jgi:hypothetical protein